MRFLVDECCPRQLADALRANGHDVRYAVDSHPRADDSVLSDLASREGRIVVIADYDFGERVIRFEERLPGVVLLAPSKEPMSVRIERISRAIGHLASALTDHLTIVDGERVRRRSLRSERRHRANRASARTSEKPLHELEQSLERGGLADQPLKTGGGSNFG